MLNESKYEQSANGADDEQSSGSSTALCSVCTIADAENEDGTCNFCAERKRTKEVDEVLARANVKREQIETPIDENDPMAVLQEAQNGNSPRIQPTVQAPIVSAVLDSFYGDAPVRHNQGGYPGGAVAAVGDKHWTEQLSEDYKAAQDAAVVNEADFPQYPAEFIRALVRENNKITKREVWSVLAEFGMNVSLGEIAEKADAIVVTDRSQTARMKQARELRLTLRKERLRIEQLRIEVKEPFLRRVNIIDGIGRQIRDLFKSKEDHLKEQEDFIKRDDERIVTEKQAERFALLEQFEYVPTDDDTDPMRFGNMTDAEWLAIYNNVEQAYHDRKAEEAAAAEAKRIEDERLTRENEKLKRNQQRLIEVQSLGFIPMGDKLQFYALQTITDVAVAAVSETGDQDYAATLRYLETLATEFKATQQRNHERKMQLVDLGMRFDGNRYSFENVRIDASTLGSAPVDVWTALVQTATDKITAIKEAREQALIDAEAERLHEAKLLAEQAEQEAVAKAASMAPDKEKLEALAGRIESIESPEMSSELTRQILIQFQAKMHAAIADLRRQVKQLD